jgi:glycosyltransferase involved in cell wall biosynthesis
MPGYHATRKNAASILAASIATYEQISPRYHDKCFYVPENAIDPERFSHSRNREASRPLRAAFVGRLVPYKSADMLLEAAAPLLRAGDLTIEILGDGPELPALRALVDREGIAETVRLRGWVAHAEISAALAECDLFTFPSIREFGGGVVLEAMAVGLVPVIVDYGGPGELVTEQTGVKVPLGTRAEIIQRLRAALAELAADPARVDTLSRNAIRRIHRLFTWDAKAAQTVDIYQWVLGRKPKPNIPMPLPDPVDERPSPSLSRLA